LESSELSLAESLFFFDGPEVDAARAALSRGERVVSFSEQATTRLAEAGIAFTRSIEALGEDPEMPLYRAAADWTRGFGTKARDGFGGTLKEALRYRSTTLWWWAELYLHHNTDAARRVRFLETAARVIERFDAGTVGTHGLAMDETLLAGRLAAARKIDFTRGGVSGEIRAAGRSAMTAGLLEASKIVATAVKGTGEDDEGLAPRAVVFVSHAAFWKTRKGKGGQEEDFEHYLDALLGGASNRGFDTVTLGVGPQTTFRTRSAGEKWRERFTLHLPKDSRYVPINRFVTPKVAAAALKAFGRAVSIRNRFRNAASLKAAFSHRGVSFDDLSHEDLGRTLLHQVPWAARCLLEFDAAFRRLNPRLVCLYAESSGLGRAAIESARALGVRSVGVQHGILYPNYFSYERGEEDITLGTPIADTTAVYGDDGVRLLEETFRYPKGRVVSTGSPRYDALAAEIRTVDRDERRRDFGVSPNERLIVIASRYAGIRDTHKASGPAFPGLLAAIEGMEGARLIVKPHPAEPKDAYDKDIIASTLGDRVRVIADRSLTDILPAADLLVTVESLSATEALVAGVPVVVLRHPSNLRDVVASGAALGVPDGVSPRLALQSLLDDVAVRAAWRKSRDAFLKDVAHGVDGVALDRILNLVSNMAGLEKEPVPGQ
jgi:CDP-Glycerol:Poly(glycerophosphate) glycerophosphotransferase